MPSRQSTKPPPSIPRGTVVNANSSPLAGRRQGHAKPQPDVTAPSNRTATGKRRRRRKARTEVSSSESSSSSSDSDNNGSSSSSSSEEESEAESEPVKKAKIQDTKRVSPRSESGSAEESKSDSSSDDSSDEDMADASSESSSDDESEADSEDEGGDMEKSKPKSKPAKPAPSTTTTSSIPVELRDITTSMTEKQFEEYYLKKLTEEFGDDLNSVRQSKDFTDRSLPVLVRALKGGVKGFSEDEMAAVLNK
ncbi:hypothetical protein H072_7038 [Dactylellina haptotyla CBS 200.50]|uniref:Ribosome assembly protein 3 n=1 Tax=Dactylellina haptotyla (strain CBS 200.50) TaxID=1284197 RepID=S8BUY6_DACHA|nr:hypothetical protein H072_7038 [Dactylellina haptotyla CBS 200.50]